MEREIDLAEEVNDILSRYIVVHNALFKLSIRKLIPIPGLFKPIEFERHRADLTGMVAELREVDEAIDYLHPSVSRYSPIVLFLTHLREYSTALADTITLLSTICHSLHLKSERSSEFTWDDHKRAVNEYNSSVDHYKELGGQLNQDFATL